MLYKKVIPNIEKEVICVLDNKADTIIPVGKVRIEKPEIILDSESDVINILNFTNPYKRYQDTICELNKQFAEYPKCINLYSLPINELQYLKQLKNKRPFEMMNDKSTPPHREKNAYYHENG